jgi:hypothetical protein
MNDIQLLMVDADDGRPTLDRGLGAAQDDGSAGTTQPTHLFCEADQNLLDKQGWGIVAPEGPAGDRLLALVDELRRHRAQQTELVQVYRVPPVMNQDQIWRTLAATSLGEAP